MYVEDSAVMDVDAVSQGGSGGGRVWWRSGHTEVQNMNAEATPTVLGADKQESAVIGGARHDLGDV
jgi:hypothetical protein